MAPMKPFGPERGAVLIEFALVFPLLLLVTLGIIDFGLLFQRYEVLTNAAREGARVSVLPGYAAADVEARVEQYILATSLSDATVTTVVAAPEAVNVGANCINVIAVTVSFDHEHSFVGGIISYFGGSLGTKTLSATSSMRSETPSGGCPGA